MLLPPLSANASIQSARGAWETCVYEQFTSASKSISGNEALRAVEAARVAESAFAACHTEEQMVYGILRLADPQDADLFLAEMKAKLKRSLVHP
jgi:hypothetical protein